MPTGAVPVAIGLVVNGVTYYAFLAVTRRALDDSGFDLIAVLWAAMIVLGPGLFQPLEQEVSRGLSRRRARGQGAGPLVFRVALLGVGLLVVLALVGIAFHEVLIDELFEGEAVMLVGLGLAMVGFWAGHLTRGALSGNGRFGAYGRYFGSEGLMRLLGGVGLALVGVAVAGPFGAVMGAAPLLAAGVALLGQKDLIRPGPTAHWSELSTALGYLMAGSLLTGLMLNIGPLTVQVVNDGAEIGEAGRFYSGLAIARIPLFFFQAIQASLLPALAALAGAHNYLGFRRELGRLLALVAIVGFLAVLGSAALGPAVTSAVLDYDLSAVDMGLMAGAMSLFMLTITLDQSLLALSGHRRMATGWAIALIAYVATLMLGGTSFRWVEVALVVAGSVGVVVMSVFLVGALRRAERSSAGGFVGEGRPATNGARL